MATIPDNRNSSMVVDWSTSYPSEVMTCPESVSRFCHLEASARDGFTAASVDFPVVADHTLFWIQIPLLKGDVAGFGSIEFYDAVLFPSDPGVQCVLIAK